MVVAAASHDKDPDEDTKNDATNTDHHPAEYELGVVARPAMLAHFVLDDELRSKGWNACILEG